MRSCDERAPECIDSHFISFWFSIDPSKTHFLRFIFEGYDNEFQMTTLDKENAILRVRAMRGSQGALVRLLLDLKEAIGLRSITLPQYKLSLPKEN